MEWHDWVLWGIVFVAVGGPIAALTVDRVFGINGRLILAVYALPGLAVIAGVCTFTALDGRPLCGLIVWGFVGGVAGTIALDVVRLAGVRLKAFPIDMPELFGAIALGMAPSFQAHVMSELVREISELPDDERTLAMQPRIGALAAMSPAARHTGMAALMHGLGHLSDQRREGMLRTQMGVLSNLSREQRVAVMMTMDSVMAAQSNGQREVRTVAPPPRGLPKLPMETFRRYASAAMPRTLVETGTPSWMLLAVGYLWHAVIGASFGITYTLLFGTGSLPLALGWGIFIWAGMMIAMPPMMPLIRFPRWFPVVPFVAHIAMAVPIGYFALEFVGDSGHRASLAGALVAAHAISAVATLV
jgi:hypothetical protein